MPVQVPPRALIWMEPARHAEPHLRPRPPLNLIKLGASNFSTIADLRALLLLRPPSNNHGNNPP